MKSKIERISVFIFTCGLFVPFLLAHRTGERISDLENRMLAGTPHIVTNEGKLNINYASDFDDWLNDNIRFRTTLVELNANLQYTLLHRLSNDNLREGKNGFIFYTDNNKPVEYQHLNRMNTAQLNQYISSMERLNKYLQEKGIAFYYMQCFNKESIYPEEYVSGVMQYGNESKAQQIVSALKQTEDIKVIPIYELLMDKKKDTLIYSKSIDPSHWNDEGAYIGYVSLMSTIKKDFPEIKWLVQSDYDIEPFCEYANIYGMTYPYSDTGYHYYIRQPRAVEYDLDSFECDNVLKFKEHNHYYINPECENNLHILVLGDSFIRQFIKDDIAEGFQETLSIDWVNIENIDELLEIYKPDIVVFENAESYIDTIINLINKVDYTNNP